MLSNISGLAGSDEKGTATSADIASIGGFFIGSGALAAGLLVKAPPPPEFARPASTPVCVGYGC